LVEECALPPVGCPSDEPRFRRIQSRLPEIWRSLTEDPQRERTVVVLPSMSLDASELARLGGSVHYEERLLFFLTLLSFPRTRLVYLSSCPIPDEVVSYYLQFLPGVPFSHARARLRMLSVMDRSDRPLSWKILERPAFLERLRRSVVNAPASHMEVYRCTSLERELAVALDLPILGADPGHLDRGTKSGSRRTFAEAGVRHADGCADLRDEQDIAQAVVHLARRTPRLRRVILKLNEGFAGAGNAVLSLGTLKIQQTTGHAEAVRRALEALHLRLRAPGGGKPEDYLQSFRRQGGVVEAYLEGRRREAPTVQLYLTPLGEVLLDSTHDQIMGGPEQMNYLGCRFPARREVRDELHQAGLTLGRHLAGLGVVGPLSIDFLAVPGRGGHWNLHALEINLRRGGTSHSMQALRFLTGGSYHPAEGVFCLATGETRYYIAADSVAPPSARGLAPQDLIDVSTDAGLHYNSSTHRGVVFHMMGSLSQYGRVGATCIGATPADAQALFELTRRTLDEESRSTRWIG
jgi:hypothetical protein